MSCNQRCNQGRTCDCSAGSVKSISLVYMFIGCIGLLFFAIYIQPKHVTMQYDCRIAEISPDVPMVVKEKCRRLMEK